MKVPPGYQWIRLKLLHNNKERHQAFILLITFVVYALFHASRKPLSVVKTVFHKPCIPKNPTKPNWCHWRPFAVLSTIFDIGGIVGGVLAGFLSDNVSSDLSMSAHDASSRTIFLRAVTCAGMLAFAAPVLFWYQAIAASGSFLTLCLLFLCGLLVTGPCALITTAVSADLGTQPSLQGNSKALATVTAIIDGTGSLGAALGPFLTGALVPYGWPTVFFMLIAADLFALVISAIIASRSYHGLGKTVLWTRA
nr:unnamed protein product [Spirometra erinaceieuropaei]